MNESQIGLWWHTTSGELFGVRQPVSCGHNIGIYRNMIATHEGLLRLSKENGSLDTSVDLTNAIRGWVVYCISDSKYYVLCNNEELLNDEGFRKKIIEEYNLEPSQCKFEFHQEMKDLLSHSGDD